LTRGLLFSGVGVSGLSLFCWFIWPPLALLPVSVAFLALGLLIDWEAPRGKSASPHRQQR
jgi:hypothetical protein